MAKVLVIGLDCAEPSLVFDSYIEHLPNMKKLLENSYYGRMRSCFPAITIPAWMVMATGKEPGEIGLYGFRQRSGNSYNDIDISHAGTVKQKKIWEMIPGKSVLVGVPPTHH